MKATLEEIYSLPMCYDRDGYVHCRYKGKRRRRSHIVAIEILGWEWDSKTHVIHHINEIKDDDRPENLQLMGVAEHLSLHHTGSICSEETKRKISESHIGENHHFYGKPCSEVRKRKISESQTGEKHWNYGKKHKQETIDKMKENHWGRKNKGCFPEETRLQMSVSGKTKIFTEEHRKSLSLAQLKVDRKGEKNAMYGKPSWNKGLTKETDERLKKSGEKQSKTKGSNYVKK